MGVASNIIADSNGIVRGKITGVVDVDGDSFTYSITGATGADTSTSYTGAGGIAHVDSDGSYTYIPKLGGSLGYYDSFSVTVSDGHGGTTDVLVGLGAIIAPTPSLDNVNITKTNTTAGVTTGSVSLGSASNNALFTNYTASGADYGTVTFNGTSYTYTRTAVGHVGGTDDTFDVMGTAYGLQIKVGTVTVTPDHQQRRTHRGHHHHHQLLGDQRARRVLAVEQRQGDPPPTPMAMPSRSWVGGCWAAS